MQLEDCTRRSVNDILEYVSDGHTEDRTKLLLRFLCNGAKLTKKINSVRGVFKILHPRDSLPASIDQLSMSPDDELTLFFYLGKCKNNKQTWYIQLYFGMTFIKHRLLILSNNPIIVIN